MRKLVVPALVVLAALNLSGCVILHSHTRVAEDGSGTLELDLSLSDGINQTLAELKTMASGSGQMDFPELDDITRESLAAAGEGHGVKVVAYEREAVDGRQKLHLELDFADLEGLSYVMSQVLSEGRDQSGLGLYDADDGNFVLKAATYDFPAPAPDAAEPAPPATTPDPTRERELMGRVMEALAELDVTMRITVPGDIVSSSAPVTEGRTSIWSMNAANMMSGEAEMDPEIVFVGKGLEITPLKEDR